MEELLILLYMILEKIDAMFKEAKYVFKNGEEIVRNGKVLKYKKTSTLSIKPKYEKSILKEIQKWIDKKYALKLDEFKVDENFFLHQKTSFFIDLISI